MKSIVKNLLVVAAAVSLTSVANAQSYKGFPAGYCTNYAAREYDKASPSWRQVNWRGNAAAWADNARAAGHWVSTRLSDGFYCSNGTIVVWRGGNDGYGHVAVIRSTNSQGIYISEMNWTGFNQISSTFLPWSSVQSRGRTGQYHFAGYIITSMWA